MFPTSKAVKATALASLKGKWVKASCAALVPVVLALIMAFVCSTLYEQIPLRFTKILILLTVVLYSVFLISPVILGCIRFFREFSQDSGTPIGEEFFYFSSKHDYLRALSFIFAFFLRLLIIGFLFLLPSFLTDMAYHGELTFLTGGATPLWFNDLWTVSLFLRGIAVLALAVVMLRYYIAPFIFAANDSVSAAEAIHQSSCASKISAMSFCGLIAGSIFWILISLLIIPMVFTLPYLILCYVFHCNFAVYHYNKSLKMKKANGNFDPDFDI